MYTGYVLRVAVCYFAVGAVAKYCDEHVSVCVCLAVCSRAYLRNHFCDFTNISVHVAMAVARSSLSGVTKSQGEETIFGVVRTILRCSRRCRVGYRRDHLIANNVMQQKGSFSTPDKRK